MSIDSPVPRPRPRPALTAAALAVALLLPLRAPAHLHGLIPERAALRAREQASLLLFFGHPFEGELEEMAEPERLAAHAPGGAVIDLKPALKPESAKGPDGKQVRRFRAGFEAAERGDYLVAFASPLRFEGEKEGFARDFAKAVVHVQAERGWDRALGDLLEIVPLTRPYGLRPGAAFHARALLDGRPLEGAAVEFERYNASPPAALPEVEFITRTARTGPGGLVVGTLDEAGWWAVTVSARHGFHAREGKQHPVSLRATFWVYAGEPLASGK